jgi:hypothetical protein
MTPSLRQTAALGAVLMLSACAAMAPGGLQPGASIAEARSMFLGPTGEYPLPGGGTRLEFARGAFGRQTYMLDFDASGSLVKSEQVLTEANFAKVVPGESAADVRMQLGRPAQVFNVAWQKLQVWNYRYYPGDCVWYQISIDAAGKVTESNYGTDPACDGPSSRD